MCTNNQWHHWCSIYLLASSGPEWRPMMHWGSSRSTDSLGNRLEPGLWPGTSFLSPASQGPGQNTSVCLICSPPQHPAVAQHTVGLLLDSVQRERHSCYYLSSVSLPPPLSISLSPPSDVVPVSTVVGSHSWLSFLKWELLVSRRLRHWWRSACQGDAF